MECGSNERGNGGLAVDCFVVLPSAMYERLGRSQNGGIVVLLSAALVAVEVAQMVHIGGGMILLLSLAVSAPTPK